MSAPLTLTDAEQAHAVAAVRERYDMSHPDAFGIVGFVVSAVNSIRAGTAVGTIVRHRETGVVAEYGCKDGLTTWRAISPAPLAGTQVAGVPDSDVCDVLYDPQVPPVERPPLGPVPRFVGELRGEHAGSEWRDRVGHTWKWFPGRGWRFFDDGKWSDIAYSFALRNAPYREVEL